MGNLQCSAESAAHLAAIARDICPFPDYSSSPHPFTMFTFNSSLHLKNHYAAVQSSLTPQQLDDFTHRLRTTFGRHGRVTYGGVGVVALSLALLFDTIARQVKGEWESKSEPIQGLFLRHPRGNYQPQIYTISEYLRLVPHIANNPTRMKDETKRYVKQLMMDERSSQKDKRWKDPKPDDITGVNTLFAQTFQSHLSIHLARLTNSTLAEVNRAVRAELRLQEQPESSRKSNETEQDAAHHSKSRQRRIPPPENNVIFNLNCDPEEASKEFLAEIARADNHTQDAFRECKSNRGVPKTWMHLIARLVWFDVINNLNLHEPQDRHREAIALRGDFDLKANALVQWPSALALAH